MATLDNFKEDLPLLVEAGLIAIKQGDEESAKKLFNAVGIIDPSRSEKKIGHALIALHKMEIPQAQKLLQEILKAEPENYRALAFLGFSHVLGVLDEEMPNPEKAKHLQKGAEIATEVLEKCQESSTRDLAQSVLDWEKGLQVAADNQGPVS